MEKEEEVDGKEVGRQYQGKDRDGLCQLKSGQG